MFKEVIKKILNYFAGRHVKKMATLKGCGQLFYHTAKIVHRDGASKNNVILMDHCWPIGKITVEGDGIVVMHPYSRIFGTTQILCVNRIEIGENSTISQNTIVCDNNNHPVSPVFREKMGRTSSMLHSSRLWKYSASAPILIGRNVWIGTNVRICKGVNIGDNSVIAANSVVTKDVPANCIAAGNPAKVVKTEIDKLPCPPFPED